MMARGKGKWMRGRGANSLRGKRINSRKSLTIETPKGIGETASSNVFPTRDETTHVPLQLQEEQDASPSHGENSGDINFLDPLVSRLVESSRTRGVNQGFDAPRNGVRGRGAIPLRGKQTNLRKSLTSSPHLSPRDETAHVPLQLQEEQDAFTSHNKNSGEVNFLDPLIWESSRSRGVNQNFHAHRNEVRGRRTNSLRGKRTNLRKKLTTQTRAEIQETTSPNLSPTRDETAHVPLQEGQDVFTSHGKNNADVNFFDPLLSRSVESLRSRGVNQGIDAPRNGVRVRGRGKRTNSRTSLTTQTREEILETTSPNLSPRRDETTHVPLQLQQEHNASTSHGENSGDINFHDPLVSRLAESPKSRDVNQVFETPTNEANRQPVVLNDDSFHPVSVTRDIGMIVRKWMRGAWIRWKYVPIDIQNSMWSSFQEKYTWEQPTEIIKEAFFKKCMHRYSSSLYQARMKVMKDYGKSHISETKGLGPSWIQANIWNQMVDLWAKQEWQDKSEASSRNRNTEKDGSITKHTCGSIPIAEHRFRLAKEMGREPTNFEIYEHVHKRRPKDKNSVGDYVDPKSKRVCADYTKSIKDKYGTNAASQPEFDAESWIQAVGSSKKGRVYGFGVGQHAKSIWNNIDSVTSGFRGDSSSMAVSEFRQRVREEVREEVRQELQREMQEMIRKSNIEMEGRLKAMETMVLQMKQQKSAQPPSNSSTPADAQYCYFQ